jgi:hypothetical protein
MERSANQREYDMGRSDCVGGLRSCSNALCCVISQKAGELRCCTWSQ